MNRLGKYCLNWTEFVKVPWMCYGTRNKKILIMEGAFCEPAWFSQSQLLKNHIYYLLKREGYILILSRDLTVCLRGKSQMRLLDTSMGLLEDFSTSQGFWYSRLISWLKGCLWNKLGPYSWRCVSKGLMASLMARTVWEGYEYISPRAENHESKS